MVMSWTLPAYVGHVRKIHTSDILKVSVKDVEYLLAIVFVQLKLQSLQQFEQSGICVDGGGPLIIR